MKIAIFVTYLPPHIGGIETVAYNQMAALSKDGHSLQVVTSACGAKTGVEIQQNVTIWRIPAWNYFEEKMSAVFPIFSPSLLLRAYKVVRDSDVVHTHDGFYLTSLAAAWWCFVLKKPLVLTQHVDMIPHPSALVMFVQKLVYATTGAFVFYVSKRIIILNSRVQKFLTDRSVSPDKIRFLPNGIDTSIFRPSKNKQEKLAARKRYSLPNDKTVLLFVGRFVPKKGFTKLIKLAPIENSIVAFAGGNAPSAETRSDHIFLGKVSRDDMPSLYRAADIFVLPSEGEGFPMTIQEAMASGLKVITTNDPAYDLYDLTDKEITLIRPTSAILQKTLEHSVSQDAVSATRDYAVDHFSLDAHSKKLTELYAEVTA